MSKEFSPLEHLEFIRNYEIDDEHRTLNMDYACKQSLDIIEKSLKALKTIKEKMVISVDESEYDNHCLTLGVKVREDRLVIIYQTLDKDRIDLLKEVLL